ncbi:hypothetical protein QBC34DRAFT_101705 [Podospora aff. communis PSN243]|uniref:C3H1-type domain-containing protein n=1 Tax=Podospora aff. communis PSN243 TaxID=3040156 RepID=A0AAV9GNT5_9PEZI|nr:hypothetical protein QBC34DRAFT_101705 [Podospora aff. communis PSN243]
MPTSPMSFEADVTNVLSIARSAVRDLSRAPSAFAAGEAAADALVVELQYLQNISQAGGLNQTSLTAHLMPCRQALKSILEVRTKYPLDSFGFGDRLNWNLDKRRFEKDVEELRLGTARLRETVKAIREAGASNQTNPVQTAKPMCPNGSGCRQAGCGLRNDHPHAPTCKDGKDCCVAGCTKFHPKTGHCPNGPACPNFRSGCPKAHPWPRSPPSNAWCPARQSCPGYDGACPMKHPRKAPCKNGSSCWKRQTCSYDHSPQGQAQSQPLAELPAAAPSQGRSWGTAELPATQ